MNEKQTFYHRTPGARFILPDGRDLIFSATDGAFTTDDPLALLELKKIADQPATMVFTKTPVIDRAEKQAASEVMDSATVAFNDDKKIPASVETVEVMQRVDPKPVLSDTGLADKLAAAKAAVAASGTPKK